jgi:protease I
LFRTLKPAESIMPNIKEAKILIMATDGFEQSELFVPLEKLRAAGAKVDVAAPEKTLQPGEIKAWNVKDWGKTVKVDRKVTDVRVDDYDAIVLPGGIINPDKLRIDKNAMKVVRDFVASGKPVAAICHGPWLLVEADAVKGRTVTSWPSLKTDIINAAGTWQDAPVVVDEGIITSRKPDDLDAFVSKIIEEIGEGRHARAA